LVRAVNAPLPPEKIRKCGYKMVHSKVYLNKYVVSTAPFSYPAFTLIQKTGLFCMFSLFNFSSIYKRTSHFLEGTGSILPEKYGAAPPKNELQN